MGIVTYFHVEIRERTTNRRVERGKKVVRPATVPTLRFTALAA